MTIISKTSEDLYHWDPTIEIQSGAWHLNKPHFLISDVAHNLAQINRYTGAANYPYNVAEHSMLVSRLMEFETGGDPYEGLLHDRSEAYLNDISSPIKGELPEYKKLERHVDELSAVVFGVPAVKSEECKTADFLALFIESYDLMPSNGTMYHDPYNLRPRAIALRNAGYRIQGLDFYASRVLFLQREADLRHGRTLSAETR